MLTATPLASVALAVHEMESLGETIALVNCHVDPVLDAPLDDDHE